MVGAEGHSKRGEKMKPKLAETDTGKGTQRKIQVKYGRYRRP